jgi:aspartyl/glutamyl-tRNA(Asn/Gln) amidotransferase C subunit
MPITLEEVRHVARLARLDLDESELLAFQGELNALIGHFQDIQGVDVAGLPARPRAVPMSNVWAEDEPGRPLDRAEAMRNASVQRAGLFIVPTILEE